MVVWFSQQFVLRSKCTGFHWKNNVTCSGHTKLWWPKSSAMMVLWQKVEIGLRAQILALQLNTLSGQYTVVSQLRSSDPLGTLTWVNKCFFSHSHRVTSIIGKVPLCSTWAVKAAQLVQPSVCPPSSLKSTHGDFLLMKSSSKKQQLMTASEAPLTSTEVAIESCWESVTTLKALLWERMRKCWENKNCQ